MDFSSAEWRHFFLAPYTVAFFFLNSKTSDRLVMKDKQIELIVHWVSKKENLNTF